MVRLILSYVLASVRNTAHWNLVGSNCLIVFLIDSLAEPESLYACTLYSAELAQPLQLRSAISAPYSSAQLRLAVFHHTPAGGVLGRAQNPLLSDSLLIGDIEIRDNGSVVAPKKLLQMFNNLRAGVPNTC